MRALVFLALACLFLFGLTACGDPPRPTPPSGTTVPPTAEDPVLKAKVGGLEQQLADALKARDAAIASGDRMKTLEASKDAAADEAALYRQKANELDAYGKTLDKQIRKEREENLQVKLYWATGIILGLSLIALGIGLWLQLKRLIIGAVCGIGLAGACWFLAFLVPYFLWIGAGILAIGVGILVVMLYRRHVALHQLVGALEAAKPADGTKAMIIDNYKTFLPQHLDTASEGVIERIRSTAKKTKAKIEAKLVSAKILKG